MRVAYYSPLPPSRSGIADYSALLLPALAGAGRRRRCPPRPVPPRAEGRRLPLPRRQRRRGPRLDRRGAAAPAGRRRPARVRPPPSRRRADLRPRGRRRLSRGDGARGRPDRAPARVRGAGQQAPAALGDEARGLPARRRGARPRDRPDRALALRRGPRQGSRVPRPDRPHPAPGLAGALDRAGGRRRSPADRLLRPSERGEAHPRAAEGVRGAARAQARGPAPARRLRVEPAPAPRASGRGDPGGVRSRRNVSGR